MEYHLGLLVQFRPLGRIAHLAGLAHQRLEVLVAPARLVFTRLGGGAAQVRAEEVVRVAVVAGPAKQRQVVLAGLRTLEQLAPFQGTDGQLDAGLDQVCLQHLCRQGGVGDGRRGAVANEQGDPEIFRAGFLEQRPGAFGIVRPVLDRMVVAEQGRGIGTDRRTGRAGAEHRVEHGLLVQREVDRLAHARVVERLVLGVDGNVGGQQGIDLVHRQVRVLLQARHVLRFRVQRDLALAGTDLLHAHVGIEGNGEHQVVDRRLAGVVVRVRRVADLGVLGVALEDERPGADRLVVQLALLAGGEQLVAVLGGIDGREGHRHIAQERRFGTVEDEAHGELVDLFHRLDQLAHAHRVEVGVAAQRRGMPGKVHSTSSAFRLRVGLK